MKLLFKSLLLVACLLSFAGCPKPTPTSDIIARFPFDGNLLDSSGHHHDAIPKGTLRFGADAAGRIHSALLLDGCDAASVPDSPDLNFHETSSFTIQAWIKTHDTLNVGIVCKGPENEGVPGYRLELKNGCPHVSITARDSNLNITGSRSVADNRWHLLTLTVSPSEVKLYVDTNQVAQKLGAHLKPDSLNTDILWIGRSPGSGLNFQGSINNLILKGGSETRSIIVDEVGSDTTTAPSNMADLPPVTLPPDLSISTITCMDSVQIIGICWPTATIGYCCGTKGTIMKTTDAGLHWSHQSTPTTSEVLSRISFAGTLNGVVIGDNQTIYRTSDGGATWILPSQVTYPNPALPQKIHLYDVKCLNSTTAIIVGGAGGTSTDPASGPVGFVLSSSGTNIGDTWNSVPPPSTPPTTYQPLFCVGKIGGSSPAAYCVLGGKGQILQGDAATGSWIDESIPNSLSWDFLSCDFSSSSLGIAATNDGQVYYYNGSGWSAETSNIGGPSPAALFCSAALTTSTVFCVVGSAPGSPAIGGQIFHRLSTGQTTPWPAGESGQPDCIYASVRNNQEVTIIPYTCIPTLVSSSPDFYTIPILRRSWSGSGK